MRLQLFILKIVASSIVMYFRCNNQRNSMDRNCAKVVLIEGSTVVLSKCRGCPHPIFKLSQNNESDNVYQQACIGLASLKPYKPTTINFYRRYKSARTQDDALVFMVPRVFARIWTMDNVNGTWLKGAFDRQGLAEFLKRGQTTCRGTSC